MFGQSLFEACTLHEYKVTYFVQANFFFLVNIMKVKLKPLEHFVELLYVIMNIFLEIIQIHFYPISIQLFIR